MRKTTLRSDAMHTKYLTYPKDPNFMKNAPSIKDYQYWRIIENKFPYDTIAKVHHLLVPRRQVSRYDLMTTQELTEYEGLLLNVLPQDYDMILLNFPKAQSVKDWLHFHLIIVK
jgi:diadenosine tetraphosphate (Ap4A) HIT family hydrolase